MAFVTYVSELSAQFAKEAMACQSLDNDEILNVRWATDDPNPVAQVSEKRRLEDLGQEAIKSKIDMRVVDAMRAVRALEEGVTLDDDDVEVEDIQMLEERDPKRRRLELENGSNNDEDVGSLPPPLTTTTNSSLLSADTLEGLKYFAEIRKNHVAPPTVAIRKTTTGLGLGDYGSDDDD